MLGAKDLFKVENVISQGNSFTSDTDLTVISGTDEHDLYLIKNPSSSSKRLMCTKFSFGIDSSSCRTILRLYSQPIITSDGTALTSVNTYIKSGAPSSQAQTFKNPTISNRGSRVDMQITPANTQSRGISRFFLLDPGQSLLLTLENSLSNASSFAESFWLEVN